MTSLSKDFPSETCAARLNSSSLNAFPAIVYIVIATEKSSNEFNRSQKSLNCWKLIPCKHYRKNNYKWIDITYWLLIKYMYTYKPLYWYVNYYLYNNWWLSSQSCNDFIFVIVSMAEQNLSKLFWSNRGSIQWMFIEVRKHKIKE